MDDRQLLKEIEKDNELAFSALIKKYERLVFNTAYKLVRNAHDAEDICQDVFLSVYRCLHQIRNKDDLSGWLFRIASNRALSHLRKKRPLSDLPVGPAMHDSDDLQPCMEPVAEGTPVSELEDKELSEELFRAIDTLPDLQRRVLLLHKFENRSHQEIAGMLDLTKASVESLIYRAKSNLRKALFAYFNTHYKQGL